MDLSAGMSGWLQCWPDWGDQSVLPLLLQGLHCWGLPLHPASPLHMSHHCLVCELQIMLGSSSWMQKDMDLQASHPWEVC